MEDDGNRGQQLPNGRGGITITPIKLPTKDHELRQGREVWWHPSWTQRRMLELGSTCISVTFSLTLAGWPQ